MNKPEDKLPDSPNSKAPNQGKKIKNQGVVRFKGRDEGFKPDSFEVEYEDGSREKSKVK